MAGASPVTLAEADHAYRSGLLELADQAYEQLLGSGSDDLVALRLLEIAVRRGDWQKARQYAQGDLLRPSVPATFWRAQVCLGLGQRKRGIALLERLLETGRDHPLALEACLTLAGFYLSDAKPEPARRVLQPWSRAHGARVDLLKARLSTVAGDLADAIERFERLRQNPEGLPIAWQERLYFDLARCRLAGGEPESSREVMQAFLERFPESEYGGEAFVMLSELGAFAGAESRQRWLTWSTNHSAQIQGYVLYHAAKAEAEAGDPLSALRRLERMDGDHPLRGAVGMARSQWLLDSGNPEGCLTSITEGAKVLGETDPLRFLKGQALYQLGRLGEAHRSFAGLAMVEGEPSRVRAAAFNGALTAVASDYHASFERCMDVLRSLAKDPKDQIAVGEAALGQVFALARDPSHHHEIPQRLDEWMAEFPDHPRNAEARLARLELALMVAPPDLDLASGILATLGRDKLEGPLARRVQYLELWHASLAGRREIVTALGQRFLRRHPQSPLVGNVRLRLAETYEASRRSAAAALELERLRGHSPESPAAIQAGFLRARQLQRRGHHDGAVKEWRSLIGRTGGELLLMARHQQALTLCQQGNRADALAQWEEVIRSQPSVELRLRALMAKGECLTQMADADVDMGEEAIAAFDSILEERNVNPIWHHQALYRKGMVHQRMKAFHKAHEAFNQVIRHFEERSAKSKNGAVSPSPQWYYRAGFESVSLLEREGLYERAALLAERLATIGGDRSEEARQRAARIRVMHFIY